MYIRYKLLSESHTVIVIVRKTTVLNVKSKFPSTVELLCPAVLMTLLYMQHHKHKLTEPLTMQSKFSINRQ